MSGNVKRKQILSLIVLVFMIFSSLAIITDSLAIGVNHSTVITSESRDTDHSYQLHVPESAHSSIFGFNSSLYNDSKYYDQNPEIATNDIQINSIAYFKGTYVLGGENTTQSPLLLLYNTSHKRMSILLSRVSSSIRYIDTMASEGDLVAFGGMPSGSRTAHFHIHHLIMRLSGTRYFTRISHLRDGQWHR